MEQDNLQSTNPIEQALPLYVSLDVNTPQEPLKATTNLIYFIMTSTTTISKYYSYQTGKFPIQSSRGYQ